MEEPDKYKIKRNSIRVRNIGATLNHGTPRKPAGSPSVDEPSSSRIVARTELEADVARIERNESFVRRCFECDQKIQLNAKLYLNWETYDFCNEICLGKYQRDFGSHCKTCGGEVSHQSMGKYSVRFGFDIRQFCKASCLNEFKKGLKTCSCCQKDISQDGEGFLAPVGDKDQFKDFCSQACMRKYDYICNPKKKLRVDKCAVCNIEKPIKVEMILDGKEHHFCTNPCFSAFKFVSNINADQCNMCSKYFERKNSDKYTIYTDNKRPKVFCCKICINVYIIVNRKIVSCQWCKVKKYNFDMIYRQFNNQEILMCSLNCLTLHTVSTSAVNRSVTKWIIAMPQQLHNIT
uniref:TRASH domain-containing protein n=1 Tax=Megaselia scalaris TaxID=36166 RepID=T1GXP5_MEGSC